MEKFEEDEKTENWPFRELADSLLWLAIPTRLGISNAVRSVVRYFSARKVLHWKATLGILVKERYSPTGNVRGKLHVLGKFVYQGKYFVIHTYIQYMFVDSTDSVQLRCCLCFVCYPIMKCGVSG